MKKKLGLFVAAFLGVAVLYAQSPVATIPFEQYGDHMFIKVKVNGSKELDYIFDTGDGLAILDISKAAELGISADHDETITSAEGTISGKKVKHNEFLIGEAPIHDVELYETDLSHLEISIGRDIDGIIGYDLLKNYVVDVNYDEMKIKLYKPSEYTYMGTGKSFDIKLTSYIPHITATTEFANGEKITSEFFVDTGAKTTVDFNTPFVEKNDLVNKIGDSYIYLVAGIGSKEYEHHKGKVNSFSFGGFEFSDIPVGLSHAKSGIQNHKKMSGIIGGAVLKKFNIVYDYHSKKMYWEKSGDFAKEFEINASGLELQLAKDKYTVLVHKVFKDSPAQAAGVKLNAVLNSVDGKDASKLGLAKLRTMLSQSGKTVDVEIDGKAIPLQLKSML
ncbi:aspartyl protease family protein [Reichenbachiella versicolor]|uniref:aspartyl protease family protein n=1 Tax=Reichenbachiella versicolor TaxID=1821036 RepID=UPI000D6E21DC|nr:aspartyl protease family protein [Reichenbachiella versicolor]